ncbi:Alpha/Beta hydrolase protein [Hyaloraphidium curvatum]|nr:Alpha/Beta hydrolase protein [Hyaloraphidium curvatum]
MASPRFQDRRIVLGGAVGEPFSFESANPANYFEALNAPDAAPRVTVWGQLFRPTSAALPVPAVIVVPGSLGVADSHLAHAGRLVELGIAALVIDPFGVRGVSSTVANQAQYSFAASAYDVLAALRALQAVPGIDPARIGAQGHSRGGSAVLTAAMRRFAEPILARRAPQAPPLRAVYAAYPWCGHQFDDPDPGSTVVRTIIGERDEWCSPQQAQAAMHAIRLRGGRAEFRLVPGAHHSFDRESGVEKVANASVTPNAPTTYVGNDGAMVHPVTGVADPKATDRELMLWAVKAGYGVRGAAIGGANGSQQLFREDMDGFWADVFGIARSKM